MSLPGKKRRLEPEQAAAAFDIDKHISVTAGPGAGKTTVLVERYLHILRQRELSIDQIVAITFTNRAANEMRERLRERLNQILQTAAEEQRRRWLNYKRTLDGAVITTIHGFCARLLREYPIEASVDPQFLLLDEHRAAMLVESVVEETLSEFINSGHVEISRLTLGVGRARLAAALAQIYREIRSQGLSFSQLARKTAENHLSDRDYKTALIGLDDCVGEFFRQPRLSIKAESKRDEFKHSWPPLRELLQTIPDYSTVGDYCFAIERFRSNRPDKTAVGDLASALDGLLWGNVSQRPNDYSGLVPQTCFDLYASQYALEMVNLLSRIDERLNEEKQKMSALDFDDLQLRALSLLERPEVLARARERYKFYLVDEFQDTNGLQRQLLERIALPKSRLGGANLFIVGDRKQSIYGFRGADVDVFREMTTTLMAAGGESKPLLLNFRSQPPLIHFFNHLFGRLFEPTEGTNTEQRSELGSVEHEPSEAKRESCNTGPLVEFLISTTKTLSEDDDPRTEQTSPEVDAKQLGRRINALIGKAVVSTTENCAPVIRTAKYSDFALLFRAMTHVQIYESVFRRANIPYQTVLGRGFYEREEITDLIQLLRFLDNKTDELALAAVLRSPLCGISDNALLALRCAPSVAETHTEDALRHFTKTRKLYYALHQHHEIAFISNDEHHLLDRADELIKQLVARRQHYAIGDLLRFAIEQSEYMTVVAATFDGAQRLANVQRLITLAERFERSGAHLIRDFVLYVEEFEAIGSRESEGQIDEAANAVRLMTIHQAKGLEFPIVIIPDLQRSSKPSDNWVLLDRHQGLTLKVPDGRGRLVAGCTFNRFEERHAWAEQFESMRLLYVAATRAQDRLILSGTTPELNALNGKSDTWLKSIWQSLELKNHTQSGIVDLTDNIQLQLTINLAEEKDETVQIVNEEIGTNILNEARSLQAVFPLLRALEPEQFDSFHKFSVTQLINYQRCPRQYYFDRVLHVPSADEMAVWNHADAPEPPANLTATLKGAVIHRFCERYTSGQNPREQVRLSLDEIIGQRRAELSDRLSEIDRDAAVRDLLPLAENYISSELFGRVERARQTTNGNITPKPEGEAGLWSELSFSLRRPLGFVSGAIDKLLITRCAETNSLDIEIIDFKTNRVGPLRSRPPADEDKQLMGIYAQADKGMVTGRRRKLSDQSQQIALDFAAATAPAYIPEPESLLSEAVSLAARDYQLQMQAYALAVRLLLPSLREADHQIKVTLHFLEPNIEFRLGEDLLEPRVCAQAIDEAMLQIVSSFEPVHFPVKPATHCRMCNFLGICAAGREYLGSGQR